MSRPFRYDAYQACYCEENAWHLCGDRRLRTKPRAAVWVSNADKTVAFAGHRAGSPLVVWDYHVVVAVGTDDGWTIYDPDSVLPGGVALEEWIEVCFGRPPRMGKMFAPRFRVVEADAFRASFRSDRSHMRLRNGHYRSPPPPWPTIGDGGTNLWDFASMNGSGPGRLARLGDLPRVLDAVVGARQSSNAP